MDESDEEYLNLVYICLAGNHNTPVDILTELAKNADVNWALSDSKDIPIELLVEMASDEDSAVRSIAATHLNTPKRSIKTHTTFRVKSAKRGLRKYPKPMHKSKNQN